MSQAMRIAILTTARSDFGLLKRVINLGAERFEVDLLVAGSHFLLSRGETVRDVEREFGGHATVRMTRFAVMREDIACAHAQVRAIAETQLAASRWFETNACDLLLFLGDRWEHIFHLGELTLRAYSTTSLTRGKRQWLELPRANFWVF